MVEVFQLIGASGLILIIIGLLLKKRTDRNVLFIAGGLFLEAYSWFIQDYIFIILQAVFVLAALYDFLKIKKRKR